MSLAKVGDRFQQKRERTRQELLAAAQRVLAAKGYHRTKVADIARAANLAVGTVYLYYPTKEKLFLELVNDVVTRLKVRVDELRERVTDPAALVRARAEAVFHFAEENRDLFRILFGNDPFHEVVRHAQDLFIADIAANLRAGMDTGVFRRSNPELLANAFVGMASQIVHWWVDQEVSPPVDEISESFLDFIFHGLGYDPARGGPKGEVGE